MKRLLLALAATALLSCQNDQASSTATAPSGGLALRIVSTKALAEVESVSVKLSWGDQTRETTVGWNDKKLRLENLPLDVRISVRMEGWKDERGRRVVYWRGDTALNLASGGTSWDMEQDAPIVIKDAEVPAAPVLSKLLPGGATVVDGKLSLTLASGKVDTVRVDTTGVDSVYADSNVVAKVGREFLIVVGAGCDSLVEVVGTSGLVSKFRIVAGRYLAPASDLVSVVSEGGSWSDSLLTIALSEGASDTIRIDPTGVTGVTKGDKSVSLVGNAYEIVVDAPGTFTVRVRGDGDREVVFLVMVKSAAVVVARPGLKAHLRMTPDWVGATCQLRVQIDDGAVDGVSLVEPSKVAFTKGPDSLWTLDWSTPQAKDGDSLEIHVYGTGSEGKPDSVLIGAKVQYDRKGPDIEVSDSMLVVGKNGGTVSWTASDARIVKSTDVVDMAGLSISCESSRECKATGVKRSFTIRAVDLLGNESTRKVEVRVDSVVPNVTVVKNAATGKELGSGDTVWVNDVLGLLVIASDSGSEFDIVAKRAGSTDSILAVGTAGYMSIPGLVQGVWDIRARDVVGNTFTWGRIVVRKVVATGDRIPGFGARLLPLPQWVAKGCSVVVVRDSGSIDNIVSTREFFPDSDRKRWVAWWPAIADSTTDSLSVAVHGQGSEGEAIIRLGARRGIDAEAPSILSITDLRGNRIASGDELHAGGDSGLVGLVLRASDEHGVVARMRGTGGDVLSPVIRGDSLVFLIGAAGVYSLEVCDTLGNDDGTDSLRTDLHVFAAPAKPFFSKDFANGVYGAGTLDLRPDGIHTLPVQISCRTDTIAFRVHDGADKWFKFEYASITSFAEQGKVQFRCVDGRDSGAVVERSWIMLQPPLIRAASDTFTTNTATISIKRDSVTAYNWMANPAGGSIEYCLATSTVDCSSDADWSLGDDSVVTATIATTGVLNARYAYQGVKSAVAKRSFIKKRVDWSLAFNSAIASVSDTVSLRKIYNVAAWGSKVDTLSVRQSAFQMKFTEKWSMSNRKLIWPVFGMSVYFDSLQSVYDFSEIDSISIGYATSGSFYDMAVYPIADGAKALHVYDTSAAASGVMTFRPADLVSDDAAVSWSDIKGAIKGLSIKVNPGMSDYVDMIPSDSTTTFTLNSIRIYGTIRAK